MHKVARTFDITTTLIILLFAHGRHTLTFNLRKTKLIRTYVGHEM